MDSAGIPWYSTGTVNVTQGSSNVAGVGTNWVNAGLKVGDIFTIDKSRLYQITAINSNTSLSLQEAYQGATGTAQVYFVIRNFAGTMQAQIAAQVSELVNKYETYIDTELKQITGPAGPTSFPYRGTWVTGRTYNGLDVVQYGNQLYMALYGHTSTSANAPGATSTAWKQLTFDAAFSATKAEIAAVANAGAKNILPVTTSETIAGITYTVMEDGRISVNGTATSRSVKNVATFTPKAGRYILSGCPQGGGSNSYQMFMRVDPNPDGATVFLDSGNGANVTCDGTLQRVGIVVESGIKMNQAIFLPMLRDINIEDATYIPYALTNSELTYINNQRNTDISEIVSDYMDLAYKKKNGQVFVIYNSALKQNLPAGTTKIATLPVNFRPSINCLTLGAVSDLSQNVLVIITNDGDISLRTNAVIPAGKTVVFNCVLN